MDIFLDGKGIHPKYLPLSLEIPMQVDPLFSKQPHITIVPLCQCGDNEDDKPPCLMSLFLLFLALNIMPNGLPYIVKSDELLFSLLTVP